MRMLLSIIAGAVMVAACAGETTTASLTATPEPTAAAATAAPSSAATPSAAAEPTATAIPSPSAAFEDITLKGKGKKVAKFTIPWHMASIAVITHKGRSNFIVHTVDSNGETLDGLVNEIGNYSGTVLFDTVETDARPVAFEIDADGSWTITVKPFTSATAWNPSTTLRGTGDSVYTVSPPSSGLVTLDLTFKGDGNFIVHAYTLHDSSEGLANEIDDFSGQVLLPDGTVTLEVVADGTWTVTPG